VLQRQAAQAQAQQLAAAQAADAARRAAQSQATQAAAETARVQQEQARMLSQLATLRNTSLALERERQQGLEAQAQARAAAAARAAAQARARAAAAEAARRAAEQAKRHPSGGGSHSGGTNGGSGGGSGNGNGGGGSSTPTPPVTDAPPPVSGGVSAVIAFARAQVGDPYEWGAAGPGTWDCSGLTMRAWAQAGVSLSHYTGAQWDETARVPLSDLRPGDLVFFGDSGPTSHHVGLYIGGDEMVEAPYTGADVRMSSIWRSDLLPYGGRP